LENIPKIVADVSNSDSLQAMARQGKVVINCVGPYRFFGEKVVKACVTEGTHHVDVSGEPQYLENMQLKYHKEAEDKGVYVVGACGFDSIPADCGTTYLIQNFGGAFILYPIDVLYPDSINKPETQHLTRIIFYCRRCQFCGRICGNEQRRKGN